MPNVTRTSVVGAVALSASLLVFAGIDRVRAQPVALYENPYLVTMDAVFADLTQSDVFKRSVKTHNAQEAQQSEADIKALDARWRADDRELIDPILEHELSQYLAQIVAASEGTITEIIVMGIKGGNVAVSSQTSDYWQGDEEKWQKTVGAKTDERFIDGVEFDESTGTFSQQMSQRFQIDGRASGAITIGFDILFKPKR